jgi:hypothetical protein
MRRGYKLRYGSDYLAPVDDFFKHCGTSIIHPANALELPSDITPESDLEEIINLVDEHTLKNLLGSHRLASFHYTEILQTPLQCLPFPGAIWVLGTGENHSGRRGPDGQLRISPQMAREFSIPVQWPSLECQN